MGVKTRHRDHWAANDKDNERDAFLSESKVRINAHSRVINYSIE